MLASEPSDASPRESSWFSYTNTFSRIMGFSFLINFFRRSIIGQGGPSGDMNRDTGEGPSSYALDSLKLFLLGSIIEGGRRFLPWIIGRFKPFQYSVTAQFSEGDPTYEWILLLLTEERVWNRSRQFRISAPSSTRRWSVKLESKKKRNDSEEHAEYVPTYDRPHLFQWNGYWVEVKQSLGADEDESSYPSNIFQVRKHLHLIMYTSDMGALAAIVEEARDRYLNTSRPHVIVHTASQPSYGYYESPWIDVKRKIRRPLDSIILQEGIIKSLVEDAQEFIRAEEWYNHAGIPHHRGYLLYGPPGTGKTSTIYAIAGELGLEIYSLSLASSYVDDAFLARAVASMPKLAIFLIEDIDCAFPSRDDNESDEPTMLPANPMAYMAPTPMNGRRSTVTLSGLLNVLDGVASDEGKIFFATTNYIDRLDPALIRPGRIDKKIQYKLATRAQAEALFLRFYPEAFTTLRSERSSPYDAQHVKPSEKGPTLHSLSQKFGALVPEHEFSTAELQGFLLSCRHDPESAVERITQWVEDEMDDRAARKRREEERNAKAKEKKEAMEAKNLQGGLARIGLNMGVNGSGGSPGHEVESRNPDAHQNAETGPVLERTTFDAATETAYANGSPLHPTDKILTTPIS